MKFSSQDEKGNVDMAKTIKGLRGEIKRTRALANKRQLQLNKAKKLREVLLSERNRLDVLTSDLNDACAGKSDWVI